MRTMKKHFELFGAAVTATIVLASCSNDELVKSYSGEAISFSTRMETRAVETTLSTLKDFKVWGDAENYPTFFLENGIATKSTDDNIYNLTTKDGMPVYWPAGVNKIHFWAYGPSDISVKPYIDNTQKKLKEYSLPNSFEKGGSEHKDLVVAYASAEHTDHGTSVELNFQHALSNINLTLASGDPSKFMVLKGAWFVNAKSQADLNFKSVTEQIDWQLTDNQSATYGVIFSEKAPTITNGSPANIIHKDQKSTDLMPIPQQTAKATLKESTDQGAYILLLCRIMAEHPGEIHQEEGKEGTEENPNATHLHRLFPINDNTDMNAEIYGYTCIPVDFNWSAGTKYTYNLEFCGKTSGGGLYPPTNLPEGLPETGDGGITIEPMPDDKKPGDKILENPITFKVTIAEWTNAKDTDIDMN